MLENVIHLYCFKCLPKDDMSRVPRCWWWRELTQQVQTSPPLLSSESWEQTRLETVTERFPRYPATFSCPWFRKAMQKGRFNFSNQVYMISDEQLWEHLPAQGARWCPKSLPPPGHAACRQLVGVVRISWSALLVGCPSLVPRQRWQLLPVQTLALGLAWQWASSQTLCRHISPSSNSWLFCCEENQKRPTGVIVLVRRTHSHQDPDWNKQLFPRWEHFNDKLP